MLQKHRFSRPAAGQHSQSHPVAGRGNEHGSGRLLFPEKQEQVSLRWMPDFEKVAKELARSGVILKLLWMEYSEEYRQLGEQPFMYFQFCFHFQKLAEHEHTTMHIPRKPGD